MTPPHELAERLAALEQRVRAAEDRLAIYQLIASYGPAVDQGLAPETAALWVADGEYVVEGVGSWVGSEQLAAMVSGDMHQGLIQAGAAHVLSLPQIFLAGDSAIAINYSRLYVRDGDGFRALRVSANRWECARGPEGWRVRRRSNHLLDGSAAGRRLLQGDQ